MTGPTPYWEDQDAGLALYLGDMREILPALGLQADLVVADPPYAETSLAWDRWPDGWPQLTASVASSMWCFGSMRMFLDRAPEFAGWKLSQDIVWEKHNGSGFHADRFKRVHETATHWYRGDWRDAHHDTPTTQDAVARTVRSKGRPAHMGERRRSLYVSEDGGSRLMRSVVRVRSMHGRAIHPTQKPSGILQPLIEYACPPGGLIVDPFAGSGSTLLTARMLGRRAIGIEANEKYCELAVQWLSQLTLEAS